MLCDAPPALDCHLGATVAKFSKAPFISAWWLLWQRMLLCCCHGSGHSGECYGIQPICHLEVAKQSTGPGSSATFLPLDSARAPDLVVSCELLGKVIGATDNYCIECQGTYCEPFPSAAYASCSMS